MLAIAGIDCDNRHLKENGPWTTNGTHNETEAQAGDQTHTLVLFHSSMPECRQ